MTPKCVDSVGRQIYSESDPILTPILEDIQCVNHISWTSCIDFRHQTLMQCSGRNIQGTSSHFTHICIKMFCSWRSFRCCAAWPLTSFPDEQLDCDLTDWYWIGLYILSTVSYHISSYHYYFLPWLLVFQIRSIWYVNFLFRPHMNQSYYTTTIFSHYS